MEKKDLANVLTSVNDSNNCLVIGINRYVDKKGNNKTTVYYLSRSEYEGQKGISCGSFNCLDKAFSSEINIGDFIRFFYGQARMYNGNAWSPVEKVDLVK